MTRRSLLLLCSAASLPAWQRKRKDGQRAPEVEVISVAIRRTTDGILEFDGTIRNCSTRNLVKLILLFHLISPDGKTLSTQRGTVGEEVLEPNQESTFQWQARDHVRAVSVNMGATDKAELPLVLTRIGPFPIE